MKNTAATLALITLLAACSGGAPGGPGGASGDPGTLVLEITDAPIDPSRIERAAIAVDRVQLHADAGADSGFVTIYDGDPVQFDLTALRNGLTQAFLAGSLAPGTYAQARLRVSDALLVMKTGEVFSTRADTIRLTSHDTSGFKVFFEPPIEIRAGVETRALLDFQLDRTFSPVPGNRMEDANFFHLHPNVRTAVLQETGELRGAVTRLDDLGEPVAAAGAAVYVLDPGETDTSLAVASTLTNEDGSFAILGLPVGSFDVQAHLDGLVGTATVDVTRGGVTDVQLLVE